MNKKLIWGIIIAVVIVVGIVLFVNNKEESQPVVNNAVSMIEWKTYTNEKFAFKLNYPSLFSEVVENQENETFLKSENCEISLEENFGHGLPDSFRIDNKKVKIDSKVFEQRTIYDANSVLDSINIYEIVPGRVLKLTDLSLYNNKTTASKCEPLFTEILSTFKFTNQVK